ncbi:MAG: hypothetical protein WDZ80_03650 [Candidatus Paceibacterota bacterium]
MGLILFVTLMFSNIAFAETYTYVNTSGDLQNIEASSPTEAINNATNRETDSGVMTASFNSGIVYGISTYTGSNVYWYVNTSDNLQTIIANSPTEAINNATNIKHDSGVMQ